ncbi:hypothetical protein NLX71_24530 [Paenibacillus sp. MZ04-78.2]|uniref:hypothetical protein n=1 Tax=Paenibacillus sp. MZ04-78.2 TaxID=2962034 RepID=UPI0020B6D1D9|nr:hypothetical protein [Paenibacillus sp. MZ04-78.2]MCP3776416.1 hypothetical protein [Paenibacillus sp. MZ04-78.2]
MEVGWVHYRRGIAVLGYGSGWRGRIKRGDMMKRNWFSILSVVAIIILLALNIGCNSSSIGSNVPPEKSKTITAESQRGDYLSITNTEYVNGVDTDDGMVMRIYTYDINSKVLSKVDDLPYTSQYPLSVVSLKEDKIYYSAAGEGKGDQLFVYDNKTKTSQRLTNELFAINRIIPHAAENKLIMTAVKKGERPLKVVFYDKQSKQMSTVNDRDMDTTVWDISYDPETNKTYAASYSENEQSKNIEKANRTQTELIPPKNQIVEIDNNSMEQRSVIELENEQILRLTARGEQILIATARHINKDPVEYSFINIKTGERQRIDLPIKARSGLFLSQDGKGVYFLGVSEKEDNGRGIHFYDFNTQKTEPIFLQKNGFINNFRLIPGDS